MRSSVRSRLAPPNALLELFTLTSLQAEHVASSVWAGPLGLRRTVPFGLVVFFLLAINGCQESSLETHCDYIQPECKRYSAKLQEVYSLASSHRRIAVERLPTTLDESFAGLTRYDPDGTARVRIARDLMQPEEFVEAVLAHEFFHIVFRDRGYSLGYVTDTSSRTLDSVGIKLTSCFIDPLIDEELVSRGFAIALERQQDLDSLKETLRRIAKDPSRFRISSDRLSQNHLAISLFCTSIQKSPADVADLEALAARVNPIITRDLALLKSAVPIPRCDNPAQCFLSAVMLRDALGLKRHISIVNLETGERR